MTSADTEPILPNITEDNEPYWASVKARDLKLPFCMRCEAAFYPPQSRCPRCLGDRLEWRHASGRGRLYSWVVMRRAAKQSAKTYENSLHAWAAYIQKQTNEAETKVEADISTAVQARAKSRDASQTLNTLVACAAFERPPGPPTLGDQPTP